MDLERSKNVAKFPERETRRLTKTIVEDLEPGPKRYYVSCGEIRELQVAVTPKGAKVFFFVRRIDGKPRRVRIGVFGDITVETARKRAMKYRGLIADGKSPVSTKTKDAEEEKEPIRGTNTIAELWARYLEDHSKPYKRPASVRNDELLYRGHIKPWGGRRRLCDLTPADVRDLHKVVVANVKAASARTRRSNTGEATANAVIRLLRHMLAMAQEWGWQADKNPASRPKLTKIPKRKRYLTGPELARLVKALPAIQNQDFADIVLLALLTGARRGTLERMRWRDLELPSRVWRLPAELTKDNEDHDVPLVPAAVAILERRLKAQRDREAPAAAPRTQRERQAAAHRARLAAAGRTWVFPGTGVSGHYTEPKRAWQTLCEAAGLADLRFHDLRRTSGSWQAAGGAGLATIARALGHSDIKTTTIYVELDLDPVRESMEKAGAAMLVAAGIDPNTGEIPAQVKPGELVPFGKERP